MTTIGLVGTVCVRVGAVMQETMPGRLRRMLPTGCTLLKVCLEGEDKNDEYDWFDERTNAQVMGETAIGAASIKHLQDRSNRKFVIHAQLVMANTPPSPQGAAQQPQDQKSSTSKFTSALCSCLRLQEREETSTMQYMQPRMQLTTVTPKSTLGNFLNRNASDASRAFPEVEISEQPPKAGVGANIAGASAPAGKKSLMGSALQQYFSANSQTDKNANVEAAPGTSGLAPVYMRRSEKPSGPPQPPQPTMTHVPPQQQQFSPPLAAFGGQPLQLLQFHAPQRQAPNQPHPSQPTQQLLPPQQPTPAVSEYPPQPHTCQLPHLTRPLHPTMQVRPAQLQYTPSPLPQQLQHTPPPLPQYTAQNPGHSGQSASYGAPPPLQQHLQSSSPPLQYFPRGSHPM